MIPVPALPVYIAFHLFDLGLALVVTSPFLVQCTALAAAVVLQCIGEVVEEVLL